MNRKGSASIELAAFVPVVALFLLIAFQFGTLLSGETLKVARAHAKAMDAVRAWEEANAASGFSRPCLEMMDQTKFMDSPQEVAVVREPICIP